MGVRRSSTSRNPTSDPSGRPIRRTWRAVRRVVPAEIPVSVALGELIDEVIAPLRPHDALDGIAFRKLGLANSGRNWANLWRQLREDRPRGPEWVAVAYAEGGRVGAPSPDEVLDEAIRSGCAGILVDTFRKDRPSPLDLSWSPLVARAREAGLFVALAGGLDESAIDRLMPLEPDLFAVRGAACRRGDRLAAIDPDRVARLARLVGSSTGHGAFRS